MYGLTEEQFADLAPYIQIPKADALHLEEESKYATTVNPAPEIIVELNTADTTQLMQVKGIGRGYAFHCSIPSAGGRVYKCRAAS